MLQNQESVRFGLYTADLHAAELRRGQDHVPLQNLPFRILTVLLREPGRVVTREELRRELWPEDTFVDFERGISTAVSKLRDALGDSATNPRFIETVGRRGYRFIAPVTLIATERPREFRTSNGNTREAPSGTAAAIAVEVPESRPEPVSSLSKRPNKPRALIIYSLLVLVGLGVLAAGLKLVIGRNTPVATQRKIMSIAVLPLQNVSGDPQQEYLSDGLTDAVTNLLAQIADLRVISRTTAMHYKHTAKTAPEIAKELGVDALVEGSVMRSGNHLRLTIQLVQAGKDRDIWANSYERELQDVLSLERELSREIAGQIRIQLTPEQEERLAQKRTVDPESYTLYLQGRYYWHQRNEQSVSRAIGYFEQAIARDPNFAPAYAGLANTYLVRQFFIPTSRHQDFAQAGSFAEKAIALDPNSADAHNAMAYVKLYRDWDFAGAEREFQQAIALNPNYATAHQWYAELLTMRGHIPQALAEVNRAVALDPQSAVIHHQAGQVLTAARQYPQAIAEYQKSLELDPNLFVNYFAMYLAYRRMDDYTQGIPYGLLHAKSIGIAYQKAFADAARVYQLQGKEAFLRKSLGVWEKAPHEGVTTYQALDYCALHEYENCLAVLQRNRHYHLVTMASTDPEFDPLRSDPRFQALLSAIGVR